MTPRTRARKAPHSHRAQLALFLTAIACGLAIGGAGALWRQHIRLKESMPRSGRQVIESDLPAPSMASTAPAQPQTAPPVTSSTRHDYALPPVTDGMVPVISRIPTNEKVVFLTIDDGIVTNQNDAGLMQSDQVKATFFLVHRFIVNDYSFFADLAQQTGSDIENHSYDHYLLPGLSYARQKDDICQNADVFAGWFGKRPLLFRPSGGGYDDTTRKAAADCSMKAIILWDAAINNGSIKYQSGHMQAGDIVLMHFRATFPEDLNAFAKDANAAGLQPVLLSDWL